MTAMAGAMTTAVVTTVGATATEMERATAMTGMVIRGVIWEMGKTRRPAATGWEARPRIQATMGWDRSAMTTVGAMAAAATVAETIEARGYQVRGGNDV